MGLLERAGRLGGGADAQSQDRIRGEVERLAALKAWERSSRSGRGEACVSLPPSSRRA
jgi:hypothetical protein